MLSLLAMAITWVQTPAEFPFDGASMGDGHDPSIVRIKGKYFCFLTSGNSFSPIKSSSDLRTWKDEGPALADGPAWLKAAIPDHRSIWAPMALVVGDKVRLYYCASEKFGSNTSYIGVAENANFDPEHPTSGWSDLGKVLDSKAGKDNFNAIDPDVLIDEKGRHWIVYGSYWSGIYLNELDPKTGKLLDPERPAIAVASNSERGNPLEAPALAYHDGYYYLFVTYGLAAQGVRSTYRMMVGRSTSPSGPYVGYDGKPMTEGGHTDVLKSSPPMFGPGGGNVFRGADGDLYMAYHYYDARRYWVNDMWGRPTVQVRKIVWGADGWPLPGLPVGETVAKAPVKPDGEWIHQADFAQPGRIRLLANGRIESEAGSGQWQMSGQTLTMTWTRGDKTFVDTLAYGPGYYVGRNQAGKVIRGVRASAKLP
ncbi:MAG: arabinan endo-1,5-alpha-L-arabinosidase [Fimbriimonas sp.]